MKHADLILRSKERISSILLQQAFVLILVVLLLAGCGGAPPTTGTITGMVLDQNMKPLENIYDDETLIVALFCISNASDVECLHEDFWDMEMNNVIDSICEADDEADDCLLHFGQGAAAVEADGSYTLSDVPPGQYGVVFIFSNPNQRSISIRRDVKPVQVGEISEFDIKTDFVRSTVTVYSPLATRFYVGPENSLVQIPEGSRQSFVFSSNPTQVFSTNLTGDIDGDQYGFSLMLASDSVTTFRVEIVVNGQVVASDEFTAKSSSYERFSSKVSGIDPSTNSGDEIQLVVKLLEGDRGGIGSDSIEPSYIDIPEQN
jgi:hypothetical protein